MKRRNNREAVLRQVDFDENGKEILTIEDMQRRYAGMDRLMVLQWGYEISRCNSEGLSDLGEAIRMFMEDEFYTHTMQTKYNKTSLRLYGTLLAIWVRADFEREFGR